MSGPGSVLVVGASAAGLSTVEALRRKGYQGTVTVLGAESHPPYDRPPLSKQVLAGTWQADRAQLRPQHHLDGLDAEFILGDRAVGLDPPTRTVRTAAGRTLCADAVVVATGARPRRFPGQDELAGVHVLRTLDDALALRADLCSSSRVVVVGDGVLGAEVAATARTMGLDVTLSGPQATPMAGLLGPVTGGLLAALHDEHGVRLRQGVAVTGLAGAHGRVTGVCLATGEILPAEVVVVAIGADPVTAWLGDGDLRVDNGLVCDARCRAAPGIYAVGDVAGWHHDGMNAVLRLENRTNATEQAAVVAANILGGTESYVPVPYFWSDQLGARIQVHGHIPADAEMTVTEGDPAARRFVARYSREGEVTGVLGWNMPKQTRQHRQEVADALIRTTPTPH